MYPNNLLRQRQVVDHAHYDFAGSDYLGLQHSPAVLKTSANALAKYGLGSCGSALVSGYHDVHQILENKLANYCHTEKALIFPSGYMANLALLSTILNKEDLVIHDKADHASIYDGIKLAGCSQKRFLRNNFDSLINLLIKNNNKFIISESLHSMDGDYLDFKKFLAITNAHNKKIIIDDAHGIGIMGEHGNLTAKSLKKYCQQEYLITGSFSKAFGCSGGFVAGSAKDIEQLIQHARPYIYTTAMPPVIAAGILASLTEIKMGVLQQKLKNNINYFYELAKINTIHLETQYYSIIPIIISDIDKAKNIHQYLLSKHIHTGFIRPPSVPSNKTRLRITISAKHDFTQIEKLVGTLCEAINIC